MNLTYKNLTIRSANAEDAPLLAHWWNDGSVMAHAGFPNGLGITAGEVAADLGSSSLILLWDKIPIGEMNYRNAGTNDAEIGIKICEAGYQNRGIGKIALSLLIQELFSMGYTRIVLDTNLKNSRAQHVYESLGFRKLRVNMNSWQNQLGQWESSVDYELTPDRFQSYLTGV